MRIFAINFRGGFYLTEDASEVPSIIKSFETVEVKVFSNLESAYMHVCQVYAKQRFGTYNPWAPCMMPSLNDLMRNRRAFVDNCQPSFRIKHPRFFAIIAYGMAMALPTNVEQVADYLMRNQVLLMKEFITEEDGQYWLEEQVNIMLSSFGAYIMEVASPIEIPVAGMEIPPLKILLRPEATQFHTQPTLYFTSDAATRGEKQRITFNTL